MSSRQPQGNLLNHLIKHIFTGKLKPGDKLPPLRNLAAKMKVDQATARIALKQLEIMNVLDIKRGDGIYVKDYMKHAGIDFLSTTLLHQPQDTDWLVDEFMVDELWEFWISVFPEVLRLASEKYSPRDIKTLMGILDDELASIHDPLKVVELEIKAQDYVAKIADNLMYLLLFNSSRPLRIKMTEMFVTNIDHEILKLHIETERTMLRSFMVDSEKDVMESMERYRELLGQYRIIMRRFYNEKHDQSIEALD